MFNNRYQVITEGEEVIVQATMPRVAINRALQGLRRAGKRQGRQLPIGETLIVSCTRLPMLRKESFREV